MPAKKTDVFPSPDEICEKLDVIDSRCVEIEAKRRMTSKDIDNVREFVLDRKKSESSGQRYFFDQYLDTPGYDLLKKKASLRLRYKNDCKNIYLQYKGPGFRSRNLLFRSEYSFHNKSRLFMKENRKDVIDFPTMKIQEVIFAPENKTMADAMHRHLGESIVNDISWAPIITQYSKEKFKCKAKGVFFEPSIDRCYTFFIKEQGIHPIAVFFEFEVEVKESANSLKKKLSHIDELDSFDRQVKTDLGLKSEHLDKYSRCATFFLEHEV